MSEFEQSHSPEHQETSWQEVVKNTERAANDLATSAKMVRAMIEIAGERGINTDLSNNETIKKLTGPDGEYEKAMVNIRGDVIRLQTELLDQGVKISKEEILERLEKME